jgi:hypothetical protein
MWFLSAFVMMYHRFPRVSAKEKMQKLEMLSQTGDSLPDISSVTARLPRGVKVRSTILNLNAGHPEFSFSTTKGTLHFLFQFSEGNPLVQRVEGVDTGNGRRTPQSCCPVQVFTVQRGS